MKTKEEIDKTYLQVCKDCGSKEIASEYCGFIKGYTKCQEDMAEEIEELKDCKRWFFEEQKRADDLRMELEYIKLTTKNK